MEIFPDLDRSVLRLQSPKCIALKANHRYTLSHTRIFTDTDSGKMTKSDEDTWLSQMLKRQVVTRTVMENCGWLMTANGGGGGSYDDVDVDASDRSDSILEPKMFVTE